MAGLPCAIHQPNFLPRLSTLAKLYTADIWIILDNVQFTRRDYQHRCYLAPAADAQLPGRWLTIPATAPAASSRGRPRRPPEGVMPHGHEHLTMPGPPTSVAGGLDL